MMSGREQGSRRLVLAFVVLVAGAVSGVATGGVRAVAAAASADVDVAIRKAPGPAPVAGVPFSIALGIGNAGPDNMSLRLLIELPEGVTAVTRNGFGCPAGTGTLDCGIQEILAGEQSDDRGRLVATRPGSYTIVARLTELTVADPNSANNTSTTTITVGTTSAALREFAVSPAKPRAGAPLRVSFAVVEAASGTPLRPSSVACAAVAGTAKVRGRGSVALSRAICTFVPPRSAKAKTLRGTVAATALGKRLKKAFAVRLR